MGADLFGLITVQQLCISINICVIKDMEVVLMTLLAEVPILLPGQDLESYFDHGTSLA
jgi:hypothetical protein